MPFETAMPSPSLMQPGGPVLGAMNAINQNEILNTQAKYAPYTQYADTMSKLAYANYLPYQLQAQALSNPLLWMSLQQRPDLAQGMLSNFLNSIPKPGQLSSGLNVPVPQEQNSLLQLAFNKARGIMNPSAQSSSPQNDLLSGPMGSQALSSQPMQQSSDPGSPLVPASQGGVQGVINKMTAPFMQSPFKPGIPFASNSGDIIDPATAKMSTQLQSAINAAQRVEPQLQRIAEEASPFMTFAGEGKEKLERLGNYFLGKKGELPTQYAKFQADLKAAPEALVKSYGLNPTNETIKRMADVIEPYRGETGEQYKQRILGTLENIRQEQITLGKNQLAGGFNLGPYRNPKEAISNGANEFKNEMIQMQGPDGKVWNVPQGKAQKFLDNGFKRYS